MTVYTSLELKTNKTMRMGTTWLPLKLLQA